MESRRRKGIDRCHCLERSNCEIKRGLKAIKDDF
jgi:hypothetical protein